MTTADRIVHETADRILAAHRVWRQYESFTDYRSRVMDELAPLRLAVEVLEKIAASETERPGAEDAWIGISPVDDDPIWEVRIARTALAAMEARRA